MPDIGLQVENLTVDFHGYGRPRRVLDDVTLSVSGAEVVGILGESGSGKSVLTQAILGMIRPPGRVIGGRIRFRADDLTEIPERAWQAIRGRRISLLVSNARARLNPLIGVGVQVENVIRAHASSMSKSQAQDRAIGMLQRVGLPDPTQRYGALPQEFSGGMCQRVVIAMALANSPALLLADEPTSGLDVTVQRQILDLLSGLVEEFGSSVLITTRDPGVVAHYCSRALVMRAGKIVEDSDVRSFFSRPSQEYSRRLLVKAVAASGATLKHS